MAIVLFIIGTLLFICGTYLTTRARYYAWNMPEAYIPPIMGGYINLLAGFIIGISSYIICKG